MRSREGKKKSGWKIEGDRGGCEINGWNEEGKREKRAEEERSEFGWRLLYLNQKKRTITVILEVKKEKQQYYYCISNRIIGS